MDLAQMEALATDLSMSVADLGARVSALEEGGHDAFAPINNYSFTPEGKVKIQSESMKFAGPWSREDGYEEDEVVTYKGLLYINIAPVAAIKSELGPGPLNKEIEEKSLRVPPLERISPGEPVGGLITTLDFKMLDPNFGNNPNYLHGVCYEFILGSPGGLLTITPPSLNVDWKNGKTGYTVKYDIFNDVIESGENNLATFGEGIETHTFNMEAGGKPAYGTPAPQKTLYICLVGAVKELKGPPFGELTPIFPAPYEFEMTGTKLLAGPGNLNPTIDPDHWLLIGNINSKESVGTAQIANGAVTTPKLAEAAVTPPKVTHASTPIPGAENTVVVAASGVSRTVVAAIKGNGVATKFAILHALGVRGLEFTLQEAAAGEPGPVVPLDAAHKVTIVNSEEAELTFTVPPGAGTVFYLTITG